MTSPAGHTIFEASEQQFTAMALETFRFQWEGNPVYRAYTDAIGTNPAQVRSLAQIPFLPVRFFKTHTIKTGNFDEAALFESSGTTGMINSRHFVKDLTWYEESFTRCFEQFYGSARDWCLLALLPSYLERSHSSLIYMTGKLIERTGHPQSGFYLYDTDALMDVLDQLGQERQKTLLLGVTFALLDLAERYRRPLPYTVIMETGGMKGRRKEMIRQEVHAILKDAFGVSTVHSEYGMTEMLSQAYSKGEGIYRCPSWMKILVRDDEDPFLVKEEGAGTINVIDLANKYSCSFIATDDAGRLYPDGSFEVLGRVDGSDLRGCSLLVV
ncbi:MAG: acyl transferase [Chitinophagaceae bacterium]